MTPDFMEQTRADRIRRADELSRLSGVRWARCYADLLDADLNPTLPLFWRWTGEVPPGFEPDRCPHDVRWAVSRNRFPVEGEWAVRGPDNMWRSVSEALQIGWIRRSS